MGNKQIRKHSLVIKMKEGSEESLNKEINGQEKMTIETKQAVIDIEKKFEEQLEKNEEVAQQLRKKETTLKKKETKLSKLEEEIKIKAVTVMNLQADVPNKNKAIEEF